MSEIERIVLAYCGGQMYHHPHDVWLHTCARIRCEGRECDRKEWETTVKSLVKKGWLTVTPAIPMLATTQAGQQAIQSNYLERTAPKQAGTP